MLVFVWQSLCAALLAIPLRDIPAALEPYLDHLDRCGDHARERRAAEFKQHLEYDTA